MSEITFVVIIIISFFSVLTTVNVVHKLVCGVKHRLNSAGTKTHCALHVTPIEPQFTFWYIPRYIPSTCLLPTHFPKTDIM